MKQRIKQLQFQAAAQIPPLLVASEWQREFTEKFAELIVRECVLQCHHNDDMDRIEKHFGVDE